MPPIPKLQRQRLASSVVGIPQIDNSDAVIAASLAKTASTFAEADIRKQGIQNRQNEKLKATLDANAKAMGEVNARFRSVGHIAQLEKDGRTALESKIPTQDFLGAKRQQFEDIASTIEDPWEAQAFRSQMSQRLVQSGLDLESAKQGRRIEEVENKTKGLQQSLAEDIDEFGRHGAVVNVPTDTGEGPTPGSHMTLVPHKFAPLFADRFASGQQQILNQMPALLSFLGAERAQELIDEGLKEHALAAVHSLAQHHPKLVAGFIKEHLDKKGLLSDSEIATVTELATKMIKAKQANAEALIVDDRAKADQQLTQKIADGDIPSNRVVQRLKDLKKISPGVADAAEASRTSSHTEFDQTNLTPLGDLIIEMDNLSKVSKLNVGTRRHETAIGAINPYGALAVLQQKVMETLSLGLHEPTMKAMLRQLNPVFTKKTNEAFENINRIMVPHVWSKPLTWSAPYFGKAEFEALKVEYMSKILMGVDKFQADFQRDPTESEVADISKEAFDELAKRRTRDNAPLGSIVRGVDGVDRKKVGMNQGIAIMSDNLSEPIQDK